GTGGRVLASAGTGGVDWAPSLWRSLEPGAYTVETSAFRAGREAGFSLTVDPMPLTPPDSCVAPLGAVASGSTLTHGGSWERGDACRSLNATASRATRHYAEYVSFTVAEPAELRFALAGARGGRLFLLEGAGTGGSVLASAASLRRSLAPGAYTLEAASYLPEREGAFALRVTSPLAVPTAAGALDAQVIPPRPGAKTVDVSGAFGGTVASYAAASSDPSVVAADADGASVTLDGVAVGAATVTVTASNAAGSAAQSFAVTVRPLAAPRAAGALAAPALTAGASATVDVAGAFAGAVDSYTATSSDAAVLDISLAGSALTLTGVAAGTAAVTVTAANPARSATQAMAVRVGLPPAPALGDPLAARTLQATETLTVDISAGFAGRIDAYTAAPGDAAVLAVTVDGSQVTLRGTAAGSTTVTVTAANAAGRAARSFNVTVDPLAAPQAGGAPLARTVAVGGELPIDVTDAFTGIVHSYSAASSDNATLAASVDGATVTLTGAAAGTATVTLGANNAAGSAAQALAVTVEEPEELAIALAAPSHCLGSEGALAPGGGRRGVGHIDLTYHITGGAPTAPSPAGGDHLRRVGRAGGRPVRGCRRRLGVCVRAAPRRHDRVLGRRHILAGVYSGNASPPAGSFVAVSVGDFRGCGLRPEGTIACWGGLSDNEFAPPAGEFAAVSLGGSDACSLRRDGTAACWGLHSSQTDPPPGAFTAIATGDKRACGLRPDAAVECWGRGRHYPPPGGSFTAVSAGLDHSCGIRADAAIACWGDNERGQTDAPAGAFTAISTARWHS
ncbi:MAG: hypothetical protein F4Z22_03545, partial [Acidimicrobiia bacterium]|nr:hypothetical protein [Acidimicrobiia bacterium]